MNILKLKQSSSMALCGAFLAASAIQSVPVQAELLSLSPDYPLINFSGAGTTQYDVTTGLFTVDSVPVSFVKPPMKTIEGGSSISESFILSIELDSLGDLIGGVPGDDLIVTGSVGAFDGVLLTAEVTKFGYRETGSSTDLFDFALIVTGGQLADQYDGYDIALTMNSEVSSFSGDFGKNFSGKAKGFLGSTPVDVLPVPLVEICTLVTLNNDQTSDYSDADEINGDGCDSFTQTLPSGIVGDVDGTYKLKVKNIGEEPLVDVVINSPEFGLVNQSIPDSCGTLDANETCTITFNEFPELNAPNLCAVTGSETKAASVTATGELSGTSVIDADPATVKCISEPSISLIKEVGPNKYNYFDANTLNQAPSINLGENVKYRFTVKNTGSDALTGVVINDPDLGIIDAPIGVDPLQPGQSVVITKNDAGFEALYVENRCKSVGSHLNVASVEGLGILSSIEVTTDDPAYVNCKSSDVVPQIKLLKKVSIDGVKFFDADSPDDSDVPKGLVGSFNTHYKLIVENTGSEKLKKVRIKDDKLNIDKYIGSLEVGEKRILDKSVRGFQHLKVSDVCQDKVGNRSNEAKVIAIGAKSSQKVVDENSANVRCVNNRPSIHIVKEVKFPGGTFKDANRPNYSPEGFVGDEVIYRLIVKNNGKEDLKNVIVNDKQLGILDQRIDNLSVGEDVVLKTATPGFENLTTSKICRCKGKQINVAKVVAEGVYSSKKIKADDHAYVRCVAPIKTIAANEIGIVKGDPHFIGGDGGTFDFHGVSGGKYSLLSDERLNINAKFDGAAHTWLDKVKVNVGLSDGVWQELTIDKEGNVKLDGAKLSFGYDNTLNDGTIIKYVEPTNLESQVQVVVYKDGRKPLGILKVWTKEGYYIELLALNKVGSHKYINMGVLTPATGVDNGQLPDGLLGQTFDKNSSPITKSDFNGFDYEVSSLDSHD